MAKSVSITPLATGTNASVLAPLQPENPLTNTIGGLVASILAVLAFPVTLAIRYPRAASGELRKIVIYDGIESKFDLDTLRQEENSFLENPDTSWQFEAENEPLSAKEWNFDTVTKSASLTGAADEGTILRSIQNAVMLPTVPRLTLASFLNKVEDVILPQNTVETVVLISQFTKELEIFRGDYTLAFFDAIGTQMAALSMESYVPPSGTTDRHFFESGSVIA